MRPLLALLVLLSVASPALADVVIPPKPPSYPHDKAAWERAVKRCNDRPTKWARDRCLRDLYEK